MKDEVIRDPLLKSAVLNSVRIWEDPEDSSEIDEAYEDYSKYILRKWVFRVICLAVIFLVTGYALTVGGYDIGFWETYEIIWDHLTDNITDVNKDYVIINLRAPVSRSASSQVLHWPCAGQ